MDLIGFLGSCLLLPLPLLTPSRIFFLHVCWLQKSYHDCRLQFPPPTDGSQFISLRKRFWLIPLRLFLVLFLEGGQWGGDVQVTVWAIGFLLTFWFPPTQLMVWPQTQSLESSYCLFILFSYRILSIWLVTSLLVSRILRQNDHSQATPTWNSGFLVIFPFHSHSSYSFLSNWYLWHFSRTHTHMYVYMFCWMTELGEGNQQEVYFYFLYVANECLKSFMV